jgi:TAT (twin-arginine translocation) pathway signal sequence
MRAKEFVVEMDRRGFLKGLAGLAASAAVPAPVAKLLSTPAGVSSLAGPAGVSALGIQAGVALLKGIQAHLDQFDAEDDDDYYEAWEDMSAELGFEATDDEGNYIHPLSDLLTLYEKKPEQAAQQLIKHIQSKAVDPADVKASFRSRADDPSDWRYQNKQNREEPELTGGYNTRATQAQQAQQVVQKVATGPGTLARATTVAKAGIDRLSEPKAIQQMPAKDMGRVEPTATLPAPTRPEVELPVNAKQKQAELVKRQGDDQKQLAEFDPGEGGFGPFKVYYEQDYLIGQFPTYEEAKDEVDFLRQSDPKSATHHWRIVDGTGETVWEYDIGDDIDAWRRSQKFQRRS